MSENDKPDSKANLPVTAPGFGAMTKAAYDALTTEQQQALAKKGFEQQLSLHETAQQSEQKHLDSSRDLDEFTHQITDLERRTRSDISGRVDSNTASGRTTIEYKRNNNTVIMVIAIAVAVLAFLMLSR